MITFFSFLHSISIPCIQNQVKLTHDFSTSIWTQFQRILQHKHFWWDVVLVFFSFCSSLLINKSILDLFNLLFKTKTTKFKTWEEKAWCTWLTFGAKQNLKPILQNNCQLVIYSLILYDLFFIALVNDFFYSFVNDWIQEYISNHNCKLQVLDVASNQVQVVEKMVVWKRYTLTCCRVRTLCWAGHTSLLFLKQLLKFVDSIL